MIIKNLTAGILCAFLFILTACKKDLIAENSASLNGAVVSSDATADDVPETAPPVHTAVYYNVNSDVAGFWQSLPARYNLTTKKYPLIIFIHGIGELGSSLSRINCCGIPYHMKNKTFPAKFVVNGVSYSFIVISPQFKKRPTPAQVQSVVDYAKSHYRVDVSRIYVAGLSMGGGSTWDYSTVYGQNAAAIVPVCGGTKPTTSMAANVAAKNLPVWTLSSTADALVPIQWAKDWISWIDSRNSSIAPQTKLTIWSSESHNATWSRAFNPQTRVDGYNVYEWLLLHKRGSSPAPAPAPAPRPAPTPAGNKAPVANAGKDQVIPKSWHFFPTLNATLSKDYDGWINSYRWTKISGPASYKLYNFAASQTKTYSLVPGTYVFRLTITDNKGATAFDDVRITISNN
jgi:pimeloyl-ACP methyl ester carboxylesterase